MADITTPETPPPTNDENSTEQIDVPTTDSGVMDPSVESTSTDTDTTMNPDTTTYISDWFNQQNITYFIVFLGIYLIIYFILGKFVNTTATAVPSNFNMVLSWSIDLIFTGVLVVSFVDGGG